MNNKDQNNLKLQWMEALGPGWPCEVWDAGVYDNQKQLRYFSGFCEKEGHHFGNPLFVSLKSKIGETNTTACRDFYFYRPLSTPLDFAPDWAEYIEINVSGSVYFFDKNKNSSPLFWNWQNCPEGMRGKTFRIPDDWRQK